MTLPGRLGTWLNCGNDALVSGELEQCSQISKYLAMTRRRTRDCTVKLYVITGDTSQGFCLFLTAVSFSDKRLQSRLETAFEWVHRAFAFVNAVSFSDKKFKSRIENALRAGLVGWNSNYFTRTASMTRAISLMNHTLTTMFKNPTGFAIGCH